MRSAAVRQYGGPEAAEIVEVPTPSAGAGQVRIRFAAGAISPVDLWVRQGILTDVGMIPRDRAVVGLGWDVAGTLDQVGDGVTDLAPGDAVVGMYRAFGPENAGAHAEYVVLDREAVAKAPASVDVAASTLPLNALTALQSIDLAGVEAGQTLLVTGAAGAVGGYAVELAARRGIRVVGLARAADAEDVRGWGASQVVTDLADVRDVDAVIDAAGLVDAAVPALRAGGVYVALTPSLGVPEADGVEVRAAEVRPDAAQLAELVRLVDAGELTLRVAGTYALADVAAAAHEAAAKPGTRGRIVLVA